MHQIIQMLVGAAYLAITDPVVGVPAWFTTTGMLCLLVGLLGEMVSVKGSLEGCLRFWIRWCVAGPARGLWWIVLQTLKIAGKAIAGIWQYTTAQPHTRQRFNPQRHYQGDLPPAPRDRPDRHA